MARKKVSVESTISDDSITGIADVNLSEKLSEALGTIIKRDFGQYIAPPPIVTPTNIIPLDYLLGGGIVSSKPVMISSTPETGKSTFCFQFSKIFQQQHPNGVIVYLDIEGAGNSATSDDPDAKAVMSRIESFGLDLKTFQYQPVILSLSGVFDLFEKLAALKQAFEEKLKKEFYVLIVWDSLSATRSSKTDASTDPNQMIGFKARELTFKLEKFSPMIAFRRFTLLIVDQVRANLKNAIDGPYAPKEKSVGMFNDYRAATSINSLNHLTGQWLYLSKKKNITFSDGMGIDGWEVSLSTEKNKNAPSQYTITCIFDKQRGFDKFWTEYRFMAEMCPSEKKIYDKSEKHLKYPLAIKQLGPMIHLKVYDPENHKNILYESKKMYRKDAKKEYETNDEFHEWFDYAIQASAHYRIIEGLFKCEVTEGECVDDIAEETGINVDEYINDADNSDAYDETTAPEEESMF